MNQKSQMFFINRTGGSSSYFVSIDVNWFCLRERCWLAWIWCTKKFSSEFSKDFDSIWVIEWDKAWLWLLLSSHWIKTRQLSRTLVNWIPKSVNFECQLSDPYLRYMRIAVS